MNHLVDIHWYCFYFERIKKREMEKRDTFMSGYRLNYVEYHYSHGLLVPITNSRFLGYIVLPLFAPFLESMLGDGGSRS